MQLSGPASSVLLLLYGLVHLLRPVDAIYFTQKEWTVKLPLGYPAKQPFAKLTGVIGDLDDVNVTWRYSINSTTRLVQVSPYTGELSLTNEVNDPLEVQFIIEVHSGQRRKIAASTRMKLIFYKPTSGSWCTFEEMASLCFLSSGPWPDLKIMENDGPQPISLAFLANRLCPDVTVRYRISEDNSKNLLINETTGQVSLRESFDYETDSSVFFSLECTLKSGNNEWKETQGGNITIINVNDNHPYLVNGDNITAYLEKILKKGSTLGLTSDIIICDNDTVTPNYNITLVDPRDFFELEVMKHNFDYCKNFRQIGLKAKRDVIFNEDIYEVNVEIEDIGLMPKYGNKTVFTIKVFNKTAIRNLSSEYSINVRADSAAFARILGPLHIHIDEQDNLMFSLRAYNRGESGIFGVTEKEGIVYVLNATALHSVPLNTIIPLLLEWKSLSNPAVTNSTFINVTITEGATDCIKNTTSIDLCDTVATCATNEDEKSCKQSRGVGIIENSCRWKKIGQHETCVSDNRYCRDGECDELERLDWNICPQDCTKSAVGVADFNKGTLGIGKNARFTCRCDPSSERCTCWHKGENITNALTKKIKNNEKPLEGTSKSISTVSTQPPNYSDSSIIERIPDNNQCGTKCYGIILACVFIVAVVVILIVSLWRLRKRKKGRSGKPKYLGSAMSLSAVPSDYVDERSSSVVSQTITINDPLLNGLRKLSIPVDNKWQISESRLIFEQTIGEGEFGKVMRAKAFGIGGIPGYSTVAVKTLKNNGTNSELQDLLSEYTLLKEVSHPNVIKLLGACTPKEGPLCIVVEYAEHGSLRSFLRKSRQLEFATYASEDSGVGSLFLGSQNGTILSRENQVSSRDLLSFMWQISKGMSYLSEMKLVHRDLAARNILVATGRVIKISDFGLSRDVYEGDTYFKTSKGRVPVKWLALESLVNHIYTYKSDVWSFGVVMWEIVMLGATPYPGVPPERLFYLLRNGYRMEKPDNCSDELYTIMRVCWRECPDERPSFHELTNTFDRMLQQDVEYLDLSFNMVHNMAYFESRSIKADEDEDDSDIHYGSLNILSTDDNEYLSRNRRENSESTCLLPLTAEDALESPLEEVEAVV